MKQLDAKLQKRLDIEYHRNAALEYDNSVTRDFRFYHDYLLRPWAQKLASEHPDAYVLDLGTGTGVVACILAGLGCRVEALDHSPEMLDRACRRADHLGISSLVHFVIGDCEALSYEDATFDAVSIQGVLHHLQDFLPTLREAERVLRPGGQLYISEPCQEGALISKIWNGLVAPLSLGKRLLLFWRRQDVQPKVSDHEESISGALLVEGVRSFGLGVDVEYVLRLRGLRLLSERWRLWLTLNLSRRTRRTRGDIVFLIGRKGISEALLPNDLRRS